MLFEHNKPWKYVIKVKRRKACFLFYVETKQKPWLKFSYRNYIKVCSWSESINPSLGMKIYILYIPFWKALLIPVKRNLMNNFSCAKTSFVPPEPRGETEERYILRAVIYWLNFPRRRNELKREKKSLRHKSERKYFFIIRRSLEAGACEADSNQGWSQHRPLRCLTSVWWPNEEKKNAFVEFAR